MRISDWSSDVCSSDLGRTEGKRGQRSCAGLWPIGVRLSRRAMGQESGGCGWGWPIADIKSSLRVAWGGGPSAQPLVEGKYADRAPFPSTTIRLVPLTLSRWGGIE